jgi:hypothetical protein
VKLRFFQPWEFDLRPYGGQDWWPQMDPELLLLLDKVRASWGQKIEISPIRGALGRHMKLSYSDHNIHRWPMVRAADVFPLMQQTPSAAQMFLEVCKDCGVTAIGCYPHWINKDGNQQCGWHIGYRPERTDSPAMWGMIRYKRRGIQHMVPINHAIFRVGQPPRSPE